MELKNLIFALTILMIKHDSITYQQAVPGLPGNPFSIFIHYYMLNNQCLI